MTTSGLVTSHEIGPVFFSIGTMGSNYLWICIWNSGICNFMGYILISDLDLAVQRFTFLMLVILVLFCYWSLVLLCSWFVSRFLPDSALKWSWFLWISRSWTVLSLFISNKYRKEYPNKLCENATFIRLGFLFYILWIFSWRSDPSGFDKSGHFFHLSKYSIVKPVFIE